MLLTRSGSPSPKYYKLSRYKQSLTTLAVVLLLPFTSPTTQAAQLQSSLPILEQTSTAVELYLESAPAKASQPKAKKSKRKSKANTKSTLANSKATAKNSRKHKSGKRAGSRRRGSGYGYSYEPVAIASHTPELIRSVMEHGHELLGHRYRSSGIAPWPLDCSGFVKYIFSLEGIQIPHSSAALSVYTSRLSDPKPGDLVFFRGSNRGSSRIGHVGMVVSNEAGDIKMIHSSSSKGIVIESITGSAYYSSRYMGAGRLPQLAGHWRQLPDSIAMP